MYGYFDYITTPIFFNTLIFLFIALYKIEKRDKTQLL
jgi:c-di-AMP phosphodiesterase-like protein